MTNKLHFTTKKEAIQYLSDLADRRIVIAKEMEIGDNEFPLVIDDREITTNHPWVGTKAIITELANEVMEPFRGDEVTVLGVVIRDNRPIGLKVKHKDSDREFYAPRKDFRVGQYNILEDVYLENKNTIGIQKTLKDWNCQHDYYGPWWEGIEKFHFRLARNAKHLAVEIAGWYKYDSSTREDMDGKDWRLVIPGDELPSVVNCHSILHDEVWTLTSTIYSSKHIDESKLKLIGDEDFWKRSMIWTIEVAKGLAIQGYDYTEVIKELEERLKGADELHVIAEKLKPQILKAQEDLGQENHFPEQISMGINGWISNPKTIANYIRKNEIGEEIPHTIIVSPRAFDKGDEYVRYVVLHELIHGAVKTECKEKGSHLNDFAKLADAMGLPKEYQN